MVAADEVGVFQRVWLCRGWRWIVSAEWDEPEPFEAPGEAVVLMVPWSWVARGHRDLAFACGLAQLFEQRYGFLPLLRVVTHLDEAATFFGPLGQEQQSAD